MSYTSTIPLNPDEKVVLDAQKHWFMLALEIFLLVVATVVPVCLLFISYALIKEINLFIPSVSYVILISLLWILLMWACIIKALTDYYLDVIRITNLRILDVDQKGLFHRNIATMRLSNIQDVTVESGGFFATIFKYGNIKIQSAGEDTEFIIRYVANPDEITAILLRGQDKDWDTNQNKTL